MDLLYSQITSDFLSMTGSNCNVLLRSLTEHGLLSTIKPGGSRKDEIISHVNVLLSVRSSHAEGLCLLHALLRQCSNAVVEENCKTWIDLLMKILESYVSSNVIGLLSSVMVQLLPMITAFPDLSRSFVIATLPRLLTLLCESKLNHPEVGLFLSICKSCIENFSTSCRPFRYKIEKFCIKHMASESEGTRELAAECFALVACCGLGAGGAESNLNSVKMSSKAAESWTTTLNRVLQTLHSVLDQLCADFNTDLTTEKHIVTESLIFPKLPTVERTSYYVLVSQYCGLTSVIRYMLTEEFPAVVSLPIDSILDVVFTSLSVLPKFILNHPTPDTLRVLTVLPQIHAEAMDLCSAVVTSARTNFIPYSQNVCRLVAQTLAGYDNLARPLESSRLSHYTTLRFSAYSLLSVLIKELGMGCGLVESCRDVVELILKDVEIKSLSCNVKTNNVNASKIRKRPYKGINQSVESTQFLTCQKKFSPRDLIGAGLEVLYSLITYCGISLTSRQSEDIWKFCFSSLKQIQNAEFGYLPEPYCDVTCRRALYLLLKALLISHCASSLGAAMKLFSGGKRDPDKEVRLCCFEGSAMCENIIHRGAVYRVLLPSPAMSNVEADLEVSGDGLFASENGAGCRIGYAKTSLHHLPSPPPPAEPMVEADLEVSGDGLVASENSASCHTGYAKTLQHHLPSLPPPAEPMVEADLEVSDDGMVASENIASSYIGYTETSLPQLPSPTPPTESVIQSHSSWSGSDLNIKASNNESENSECLQMMLNDFVDADSDSE